MIRFITGIPARLWAYALAVGAFLAVLGKVYLMGRKDADTRHALDERESEDADQDRADAIRKRVSDSVRNETDGYRD